MLDLCGTGNSLKTVVAEGLFLEGPSPGGADKFTSCVVVHKCIYMMQMFTTFAESLIILIMLFKTSLRLCEAESASHNHPCVEKCDTLWL